MKELAYRFIVDCSKFEFEISIHPFEWKFETFKYFEYGFWIGPLLISLELFGKQKLPPGIQKILDDLEDFE